MGDEFTGYRCWYCGQRLKAHSGGMESPPDEQTVDHVLPKSRGGKSVPQNTVLACRRCNCSKGRKTLEEYRAYVQAERFPTVAIAAVLAGYIDDTGDDAPVLRDAIAHLEGQVEPIVFYGERF